MDIIDVIGPEQAPIIQVADWSEWDQEWQAGQSYTLEQAQLLYAELGETLDRLGALTPKIRR